MVLHSIKYGVPNSILEESGSSVGYANNMDSKINDSITGSNKISEILDSYEDAIKGPESAKWLEATQHEVDGLVKLKHG